MFSKRESMVLIALSVALLTAGGTASFAADALDSNEPKSIEQTNTATKSNTEEAIVVDIDKEEIENDSSPTVTSYTR